MVSHVHRCIYIHIPKAAGISIEQVFIDALGLDFYNRSSLLLGVNTNRDKGSPLLSHLTAEEMTEYHFVSPDQFRDYFKFSFVRNPYDRVFSFYEYFGYKMLVSFETFVLRFLPLLFHDDTISYFIQPMYHYLYDGNGNCLVDFIGKVENIHNDFPVVSKRLKLGEVKLQKLNESKRISRKTYLIRLLRFIKKRPSMVLYTSFRSESKKKIFTPEMCDCVRNLYKADFDHFKYDY